MNGHSDVVMGLVIVKSDELKQKLFFIQYAVGAVPSAFDCYLVNRGLKTLHVRMKRHGENGMAVAKYLEQNDRVATVNYPGNVECLFSLFIVLIQALSRTRSMRFSRKTPAECPVWLLSRRRVTSKTARRC